MTKTTAAAKDKSEEVAAPTVDLNNRTVHLDAPIQRGSTTIASFDIRKPSAGELRGVTLTALADMDVTALGKVLPRITTPTIMQKEVETMDPADLLDCATAVASFLLKTHQRKEAFQS